MRQIIDTLFSVPQPSVRRGFRVRSSRSHSRSRSSGYRSSGVLGSSSSTSEDEEKEKKRSRNTSILLILGLIAFAAFAAFCERRDDVANDQ